MKVKIPMPRTGMNPRSAKVDHARVEGFRMGILCGCAVLNDRYDFTDEELEDWIDNCNILLESISNKVDSPKYICQELEKMTGRDLSFG